MRLSLFSLLLLSTAAPAFADPIPGEPTERIEAVQAEPPARVEREERSYSRDADVDRPARPQRVDRDFTPSPRVERSGPPSSPSPPANPPRRTWPSGAAERWSRPAPADDGGARQDRGERARRLRRTAGSNAAAGGARFRRRPVRPSSARPFRGPRASARPPRDVSPGSVAGRDLRDRIAAEGLRRDRIESAQWRHDWRQDRRYDWRRHRDRDRNRFHLSVYFDPFGWQYRDYDIGWRLPVAILQQRATGCRTRGRIACPRSAAIIAGSATTMTCCWWTSGTAACSTGFQRFFW